MKLQVMRKLTAVTLAGAMSVSLAMAGNITVSAEEDQAVLSQEQDESLPESKEEETDSSEEAVDETGTGTETGGTVAEEDMTEPGDTENGQTGGSPVQNGWVWTDEGWYLYRNGVMLTGWQWVGTNCYYMYETGIMAADTWIDNYYVDASGVWIPSYQPPHWILSSAGWWYRNADGSYPANSWKLIDGQWYYFNGAGYMVTGWQQIGGTWYYLSGSGAMLTGWQYLGGAWYYLDVSGAMKTGWLLDGETWYYLSGSGAMQTGWLLLGNTWYYLDGSGAMWTGKQEIGKQIYFLKDNGAMLTGWNLEEDGWYYYGPSGAMQTGWVLDGSTWYYCEPKTGVMQTGWLTLNKTRYYLNDSGAMQVGWFKVDENWYYSDASGALVTSKWVGNYYVQADGSMAVSQFIGDLYVDEYGRWVETTGDDEVFEIELADGKTTYVVGQYDQTASNEVFTLLNRYRLENGLNQLSRRNANLQTAAKTRGYELAYNYSDTRPNGEGYSSVYEGSCAEIYVGASGMTAEGAMDLWKNSMDHKIHLLGAYTNVGVTVFKANVDGQTRNFYVLLFEIPEQE